MQPKEVKWSDSGDLVVLCTEDSFYVLRYAKEVAAAAFESGEPIGEEGIEGAFELVHEISEQIRTCIWVGDCLIYTNTTGRLNYTVGGEVITMHHLDRPLYITGYLPKENRLYCIDREYSIVSYSLLLSMLEYQTAVVRRDGERPPSCRRCRRTSTTGSRDSSRRRASRRRRSPSPPTPSTSSSWRCSWRSSSAPRDHAGQPERGQVEAAGTCAGLQGNLQLAEECLVRAAIAGLLLLYTSTGHAEGVERLAELARKKGKLNISFLCSFLRGNTESCLQLLLGAERAPRPPSSRAPTCRRE